MRTNKFFKLESSRKHFGWFLRTYCKLGSISVETDNAAYMSAYYSTYYDSTIIQPDD